MPSASRRNRARLQDRRAVARRKKKKLSLQFVSVVSKSKTRE